MKGFVADCEHRRGEGMLLPGLTEELSDERRRLTSQLRELERAAWLAGNPALLYCGVCEAAVSSEAAIEGPLKDWPHCPIHASKPLMIHSASTRMATLGAPRG